MSQSEPYISISLVNPKRKYIQHPYFLLRLDLWTFFCQVYCTVTVLQSVCPKCCKGEWACLNVELGAVQCPGRAAGPLVPGVLRVQSVAKRVCVQSVAKVYGPMLLQSEPYSARGHFCQVVCDYGMVLIWAIHESKVR
jgi:hypothetical protein